METYFLSLGFAGIFSKVISMLKIFKIVALVFLVVFLLSAQTSFAQSTCKATSVGVEKLPAGSSPEPGKEYVVNATFSSCDASKVRYCIRVRQGNISSPPSCVNVDPARGFKARFTQPGENILEAYAVDIATGNLVTSSFTTKSFTVQGSQASQPPVVTNPPAGNVQQPGSGNVQQSQGNGSGNTPPTVNQGDPNAVVGTFKAPTSFGSIGALVVGVINFALGLIGALSLLFIIIGGVRMVASAGNEAAITAGKKTVIWAVIGLVVALLAYTIIAGLEALLGRT